MSTAARTTVIGPEASARNFLSPTDLPWRGLWMAVRPANAFPNRIRRVIVGVDFAPSTERALSMVSRAVGATDTAMELVYVVDVFTEMFVLGNTSLRRHPRQLRRNLHAMLSRRVAAARDQGASCSSTILVGLPGLALVRHAERTDADALVLGHQQGRCSAGQAPDPLTWVGLAARRVLRHPDWRASSPG
jgi:nucleotide-binding universal stress UspA family protein